MQIGVVIPTFDRFATGEIFARMVRTIEDLGYHSAWFGDHVILPHPAPGGLPILVGGNHAKALRRAALLGDGWHPLFMKEAEYAAARAEIERLRKEAGIARPFLFSYSAPQGKLTDEPPATPQFGGK